MRRSPFRLGLSARLLLFGLMATLLVMGVGGWVLRENIHAAVMRGFESRLNERAERVLARMVVNAADELMVERPRSNDEFGQIFSGWYWQITGSGISMRSRSMWDVGTIAVRPNGRGHLLHASGPRNEHLLGLSRQTELGGKSVSLSVFGPAEEVDRELIRLDRLLAITLLLALLVLTATTVMQVRFGLRPLRRLRHAVSSVREGTEERVGDGYGPDLDPLAQELDEMLKRNARVVVRGRAHAADLSHALKKPLALLGAEAGLGSNMDSRFVMEQVRGMSGLIDRHLVRAASSASSEGAAHQPRFSLSDSLWPLLALMRNLHQSRNINWASDFDDQVTWRGESTDFEEMLGNLLDNAGKWARTQVRVSTMQQDGFVVITVEDDGPGLNAEQISQAAHRGKRFDETVEGSGLGLAITTDIAETYGGRLVLERSKMGGLRAVLYLPG